MTTFRNILVPIDFSTHAEQALAVATELARRFDASMTILHAVAIPSYALPEAYLLASPEVIAELMQKLNDLVRAARAKALAQGAPRVDALLVEGAAAAEIVRVAAEHGHDLVVMGTHGRTGITHALLGSVAERVVRRAPCPVLTVRDPQAPSAS